MHETNVKHTGKEGILLATAFSMVIFRLLIQRQIYAIITIPPNVFMSINLLTGKNIFQNSCVSMKLYVILQMWYPRHVYPTGRKTGMYPPELTLYRIWRGNHTTFWKSVRWRFVFDCFEPEKFTTIRKIKNNAGADTTGRYIHTPLVCGRFTGLHAHFTGIAYHQWRGCPVCLFVFRRFSQGQKQRTSRR